MEKQQKIVLFSGIGVVLILIGVLIWLVFFRNSDQDADTPREQAELTLTPSDDYLQMQNDSLRLVADMAALEVMDRDISDLGMNLTPEQMDLVNKYNEARNNIETLMAELADERARSAKSQKRSQAEIESYRKKVAELEGQISQLKDYCKDLIGRLADMTQKYEEQVQINTELSERNKALEQTVSTTKTQNEALATTVNNAKRLILTGVSLKAYNKKGKPEKKVQKAAKLGVAFTVTANNTASPGMKDFYITIKTPEGQLLTGGGAFSAEGTTLQATARRQVEYANEEVSTSIYWDVNTTLTPGQYTVKVFCDGECLTTRHVELK